MGFFTTSSFWRVSATVALAGATVSCSSGGVTSRLSSGNALDLSNPPEIVSFNGIARVALQAVTNPATGAPALEYAGAFVPPTIRVSPGDSIDITYTDSLPPTNTEPLNATNLHFHGLSTSPNPPADDAIDILAMPGQTLHYVVPVPKTEPPGLYWYHSHSHGEANWQLYTGMSGAIVVNGTASFASETAGLPERVIVLRNVLAHPAYSSLALARRAAMERVRKLRSVHGLDTGTDGVCQQPFGIQGEYTTINGRATGATLAMQPGSRQLWRVVNASADGYYDLSVDGQTLHVVAIDGVPVKAYPGAQEQNVRDVVLAPAERAEFTVTGPVAATAFRTTCFDTGPDGDSNPSQVLAEVVPGATAQLTSVPVPGPTAPASGTYEMPIGNSFAQQRTVDFTEDETTGDNFYLNGVSFSFAAPPMFVAKAGTVERWSLLNDTAEVHAFHIHQVHFITQDVDGVTQPALWRDTVNLPIAHADGTPSVTHVLIDLRDPIIRGSFLFHCHLLQHEDDGMMARILVQ
jgi:FtsP/CotA-like multicopper oxidase with cupredoxin domain